MCEKERNTGFWEGNLKDSEHVQDIDLDGRAILNFSSWNRLRGVWDLVWIDLVQEKDTWRVLVNAVMNMRVAYSARDFLISC